MGYVSEPPSKPPRFSLRDPSTVDGFLIAFAIITALALAAYLALLLLGFIPWA
jgi:hypothetical protein